MTLGIFGHAFAYEMECIVRLFFPGNKINLIKQDNLADENTIVTRILPRGAGRLTLLVALSLNGSKKVAEQEIDAKMPEDNELLERALGLLLFNLLCEETGKRPVWGVLTGIRPVRLCEKWALSGLSEKQISERLIRDYLVLPEKAELCLKIGREQAPFLKENTQDSFSLYISIPFCPSRCLYCSFVSYTVHRDGALIPEYVDFLCKELAYTGKIARDLGLKLKTVYMGGGTPTTLSAGQLEEIFKTVEASFDLSGVLEYTVEAGRPDTVTSEKLFVMRSFGVGRISINPQSMNDSVLRAIGRPHSSQQVRESFELAQNAGFKCVNMDLIAGLPSETLQCFRESFGQVRGLAPQNITVHTLTVKRSSNLRENGDAFLNVNPETAEMLDWAETGLAAGGYIPYYLYKQKAAVENLENIGFSKPGYAGVYNIYSMQDTHTILAAGAGAVSKLCLKEGHTGRIFNHKYPNEYLRNFAEILKRKGAVYEADY